MNATCPLCRRNSWLTADGLAYHLTHDHSAEAVADELARAVTAAQPVDVQKPTRQCTKLPYPNEHEARVALVGTVIGRNRGKAKRRERRVYPCKKPGCNAWHLTSQELSEGHQT